MKRFNPQINFFLFFCFSLVLAWSSCCSPVEFTTLMGTPVRVGDSSTVFIFLNTECPICSKYQGEFGKLNRRHPNTPIYYVFCGEQAINDIKAFCAYDSIPSPMIVRDTSFVLAKRLKASITPQAVIVKEGEIRYSGKLDDRFLSLGSSRPHATTNYINNALISLSENGTVQIPRTEAVGCFIEPR